MVDLSEPIFNLENFSDDSKVWDEKILYYQYKERVPYSYGMYANELFELM